MERAALPSWKVTMLLADSAQAVGGKLYILGGGWTLTGPAPTPSAIVLKFEVPWDQANRNHQLRLELVTADGVPVTIPGPVGEQPVVITADFEVGRPPGIAPGSALDFPFTINLGPLPLMPGRYEWRCVLAGEVLQTCTFTMRDIAPA